MIKPRTLSRVIYKALKTFPAIVVTGPRQSGKTTLLKTLFSQTHSFVTLENPDMRMRAREDPLAFLEQYNPPVIIDEIQYAPELLSYVKTKIDEDRKPGRWLFTGSQNFSLMQGVSQSLAGRAAVLSLLPFSYAEAVGRGNTTKDLLNFLKEIKVNIKARGTKEIPLVRWILRGAYPEIVSHPKVDRGLWCASYISTYLERDVRQITNVDDLGQFERFLRMCAVRTGHILNLSEIARDIGISVPTAKRWLSLLQTSYQVCLLYPFYKNIGKRLIKSPKLYFMDTALASYLLGLHNQEMLLNSPSLGSLFETMVVVDFYKRFLHFGQMPSMYYLRSRDGLEIDLVLEIGQKLTLIEIKSSVTVTPRHSYPLEKMLKKIKKDIVHNFIISRSEENFLLSKNVANYRWSNILGI